MTLTLNSPITDEQWDAITDVDFEHTDRIWFKTKHGKEVEFVKRKNGRWIPIIKGERGYSAGDFRCSVCGDPCKCYHLTNFCPNCGADMRKEGKTNV